MSSYLLLVHVEVLKTSLCSLGLRNDNFLNAQ